LNGKTFGPLSVYFERGFSRGRSSGQWRYTNPLNGKSELFDKTIKLGALETHSVVGDILPNPNVKHRTCKQIEHTKAYEDRDSVQPNAGTHHVSDA